MKIENVTLINGTRTDELTAERFTSYIRVEQTHVESLQALGLKNQSKTVNA